MWYRSTRTGKVIHSSVIRTIDNIWGDGMFECLLNDGLFVKEENPSVIDVLYGTSSRKYAAIRYQEVHGGTLDEAFEGVDILKRDMARVFKTKNGQKGKKRQWKTTPKRDVAELADTLTSPDTSKLSVESGVTGSQSYSSVMPGQEEIEMWSDGECQGSSSTTIS